MVEFEELRQALKETCGFDCYENPKECKCFGVWDKKERESLGIYDYDEETDPFYSVYECEFFNTMSTPTHHILSFPHEYRLKNGVPDYFDLSPLKKLENQS